MGRYLIAFLKSFDRIIVTTERSAEIVIYGDIHHMNVNVFAIFEGYHDLYQLPFIIHGEPAPLPTPTPFDYGSNGINKVYNNCLLYTSDAADE